MEILQKVILLCVYVQDWTLRQRGQFLNYNKKMLGWAIYDRKKKLKATIFEFEIQLDT